MVADIRSTHKKQLHFLFANNKQSKKEIKKKKFTYNSIKKYLGMKLFKEVEALYTESYKTLLKEIF